MPDIGREDRSAEESLLRPFDDWSDDSLSAESRDGQGASALSRDDELSAIRRSFESLSRRYTGLSERYAEALSNRKKAELNLRLFKLKDKYFKRSLGYQVFHALIGCRRPVDVFKLPGELFAVVQRYGAEKGERKKLAGKIQEVRRALEELESFDLPSGSDSGWAQDGVLTAGAVLDMCNIARERAKSSALFKTVLRTGSFQGRDLLAWLASRGRYDYQQIITAIESYRDSATKEEGWPVLRSLVLPWAVHLARVMSGQSFNRDDEVNAYTLLSVLLDLYGVENISADAVATAGALAVVLGNREDLAAILPLLPREDLARGFLSIDYQHPCWGGDVDAWLGEINRFLQSFAIEPISFAEEGAGFFSRISCQADEFISDGPLVTVIVTAWRPGEELLHAVKSILSQSWRNIELIIVDDASPDSYLPVLDACKARDHRVKVIRQSCNQGTYMARNAALRVASGKYVTFQDSDDWSHPRRVELQAKILENNERLVSCYSYCLRVSESLHFAKPDRPIYRKNTSSMMFRRESVLNAIGYMDSVRKGADTEYGSRMSLVFGPESSIQITAPLAFVRLGEESLSRQEFKFGWHHPARMAYEGSYKYWHSLICSGKDLPYFEGAADKRKFPAPLRFQLKQSAGGQRIYDVIFIGDWRAYGGPQRSMIEEIKALHRSGMRIGICMLEAYRFMVPNMQGLCNAINELIHAGMVDRVVPDDKLTVRLAILRYPPILQWISHDAFAWSIESAWIVANQAPHERDGRDVRYHVADCVRNARQLFAVDPVWVPQGFHVRQMLSGNVPPHLLSSYDSPGIIDLTDWQVPAKRGSWRSNVPVVGRYSRDNSMKFPATARKMLSAYMADMKVDVRIMGGEGAVSELLSGMSIPENWKIYPYGNFSVDEFLSQIDFFVYFDNEHSVEAFGRSILEALAGGLVVILPASFREVFGEAAVYCEVEEVSMVIDRYYSDRKLYEDQVEKASVIVAERFSYEAFSRRVADAIQGAAS
jgi:glycosyltransferase involved in cell wall biosynthesis